MKCLFFNCRVLASPDKKFALQRLCKLERLDVIFLQETLGDGNLINQFLKKFLLEWNFIFLDVRGRSSGCVMGLNNRSIILENVWGGKGFLGVDNSSSDNDIPLRIINIYGPNQIGIFIGKTFCKTILCN